MYFYASLPSSPYLHTFSPHYCITYFTYLFWFGVASTFTNPPHALECCYTSMHSNICEYLAVFYAERKYYAGVPCVRECNKIKFQNEIGRIFWTMKLFFIYVACMQQEELSIESNHVNPCTGPMPIQSMVYVHINKSTPVDVLLIMEQKLFSKLSREIIHFLI